MVDIPRPKLNKIPGGGMPLAKQENHVKDLTKLTRIELLELKDREGKLLDNKAKLSRLPDKGQRIQNLYERVVQELQRRVNVDDAAVMFSELNIASRGEMILNRLEWNHGAKVVSDGTDPSEDVLDSDDESEMDPLRIIAQRNMHERKIITLPPEPTLITQKDLEDIQSFYDESKDAEEKNELEDTEEIRADIVEIAQRNMHERKIIMLPPEPNLMTQKDLEDIQSFYDESKDAVEKKELEDTEVIRADIVEIDVDGEKLSALKPKLKQIGKSLQLSQKNNNSDNSSCSTPEQWQDIDQHVRYLVEKVELKNQPPQREKFKPYKTTISNVHDPEKEKHRKKGKHWEVTAATPPLIQHSGTKMLNLLASVEIQSNYLMKLKELQELQAVDRLSAKIERLEGRKLGLPSMELLKSNKSFTSYRDPANHIEGVQIQNEAEEIHDLLDEEKPRGSTNYKFFE